MPKALHCWSSGKDSAWALHAARQDPDLEIVGLLTTVTRPYERVSMHGVRESILRAQAAATGLPLHVVDIPAPCSNEEYENAMRAFFDSSAADGVTHMIFGDLFLEDLRAWREAKLAEAGLQAVFPLWQRDTAALAREMIAGGLKACIATLDPKKMPRELAGRAFDAALLDALPADVDPCAENGEFHTVAWAGPMFTRPVPLKTGETVEREGFVFTDFDLADEQT